MDVSRQKLRGVVLSEMEAIGARPTEEQIDKIVEDRLREEVRRGVQTIQYQVVTLMTTNGQAPFINVFTPELARLKIEEPLGLVPEKAEKVDIAVTVNGGGVMGQDREASFLRSRGLRSSSPHIRWH